MSTAFVPDAGTYFYTKRRPIARVVNDGSFLAIAERVVMQEDTSYRGEVMLCMAHDDHAIVTETNSLGKPRRTVLPLDMWEFFPVGPEVLRCLGITQDGGAS